MRLVRLAQLLLLPGLISYILGATITVEGTGYSKEGAIQSALRGAVEQAAGLSIHSETIVQNFSVLSDKIISDAVGYVSSYRVAAVTQQYGLVKVKVQAEVALGKLEADLSAKGLLYKQIGKPRVMIVIDERSGGKQLLEKTAAHSIEDYLQKNGFTLVDQKQLLVSTAGKRVSAAGTYSFFQGADLLVTGHVSVSEPLAVMVYGVQFYSVSVQVNAKVIRSDNGQVIASAVKTVSKKSRDPHSATNIGLSTGGESIAMELLDDLNTFWQSAVYNENTIEVVVKGGREPQLAALEEGFLHLPVIRSFQMRYLLGSLAVYDFDVRGSVHDFRAAIKKNESMQSVVIDSMYSGRIVLRLDVADFKDDRIDPEHIDLLIATLRIDPVFPSRIRSYENQPLVHFSLPKNSPNKYKVKITIPDIMETFSETTVEQKNTENGLCSVQLLLNDTRVLGNTSNRKVYAEIELCDVSNRKMICQPIAAPVTIYEKNAMDWKVPGTIATFVTFRDQAVIDIASKSIKGLSDSHLKGITKNLLKGSAVFTAVKESGISYVKDPIALPGTVMLDRVQFPLETVKRAAGDCDDLSVLYASLLSSVGIPCAMVIFPGHVFVMFDTGIFEKNRYRLSLDTSLTITHNGTLWVPVETTAPGLDSKMPGLMPRRNSATHCQLVNIYR
jgi:hypothetical protein